MSALHCLQAQQFSRLESIYSTLTICPDMELSPAATLFSKFISKSVLWVQKAFSHRNNVYKRGCCTNAWLSHSVLETWPWLHHSHQPLFILLLWESAFWVPTWDACRSPLPAPGSLHCGFFRLYCGSSWGEGTGQPSQELGAILPETLITRWVSDGYRCLWVTYSCCRAEEGHRPFGPVSSPSSEWGTEVKRLFPK